MPTLRALLGPILASSLALVTFLALYWSPTLDPRLASPPVHFWLVSATSLLAFVLTVVVSMAGIRAGDHRVAFLGAAFVGLAGFFALHGLSTPGFLIGRSRVPDEIPVLARVLALADTYDALTSDRSYRPSWSPEQAQLLISEEAGHAFDPACARAWLRMTGAPADRTSD